MVFSPIFRIFTDRNTGVHTRIEEINKSFAYKKNYVKNITNKLFAYIDEAVLKNVNRGIIKVVLERLTVLSEDFIFDTVIV